MTEEQTNQAESVDATADPAADAESAQPVETPEPTVEEAASAAESAGAAEPAKTTRTTRTTRATKSTKSAKAAEEAKATASADAEPTEDAEPTKDAEPTAAKSTEPAKDADTEPVDPERQAEIDALAAELLGNAPATKPARRSRRVTVKDPNEIDPAAATAETADEAEAEAAAPAKKTTRARRGSKAAAADEASVEETPAKGDAPAEPSTDGRESASADAVESDTTAASDDRGADGDTGDAESGDEASEGSNRSRSRRGRSRSRNGNGAGDTASASESDDDRGSGRGRDRGRKRSGGRLGDDVEPDILPDDVLLPIAGILDVLDNYAFVRTTGYLAGVTDVYVSLGQVKKYGLRKGDAVVGTIRQPREGEQQGRQKYNALVKVDSINGQAPDASTTRPEVTALTPVQPSAKLAGSTRKGQRALVLGDTGSGKSKAIAALAAEVSAAQPEAHLMVILVGPRPEEVTDFRRSIKGEVVVSGLDLSADDHITVVELAVERAKRLVELGIEVVVLIDSVTELGRAYAHLVPGSRSLLEDPSIGLPAKRILGAARATEEGASLTIVATASAEHPLDRLIATELSGVANQITQL